MTKEEMLELKVMMKEVVGDELKPINARLDKIEFETSKISSIEKETAKIPNIETRLDKIEIETSKIPNIETRLDKIEIETSKIPNIETRLDKIEIETSKISTIETKLTKLEVKIENETDRSIKIIAEGHGAINRKLDEALGVESRVENVENRVSAVEYTLKK